MSVSASQYSTGGGEGATGLKIPLDFNPNPYYNPVLVRIRIICLRRDGDGIQPVVFGPLLRLLQQNRRPVLSGGPPPGGEGERPLAAVYPGQRPALFPEAAGCGASDPKDHHQHHCQGVHRRGLPLSGPQRALPGEKHHPHRRRAGLCPKGAPAHLSGGGAGHIPHPGGVLLGICKGR